MTNRGFRPWIAPPRLCVGDGRAAGNQTYTSLALAAMDEFLKLVHFNYPLWISCMEDGKVHLNEDEYYRAFPRCIGNRQVGFATEASKETSLVFLSSSTLVDTLMDVNRWMGIFQTIIAKAKIVEVVSGCSRGTRCCALQLMEAEFHVLSPFVPTRLVKFLRFCKRHREDVWAVVDISIDSNGTCQRLPSGCLIQDMGRGWSKVTWVEHVEYDESRIYPNCRPIIRTGAGFGALRWLATLKRQCESTAFLINASVDGISHGGRTEMSKLTQRMIRKFISRMCLSIYPSWEQLGESENETKIIWKEFKQPGQPDGRLSATTSVWMAETKDRLLQFLKDPKMRSYWDNSSEGETFHELISIPKGPDSNNAISVIRATVTSGNDCPSHDLILQESWQDASGALIVFSPIDVSSLNFVMNGGDSKNVMVVPSGFVILPTAHLSNGCGCLLTGSFQFSWDSPASADPDENVIGLIKSFSSRILANIEEAMART